MDPDKQGRRSVPRVRARDGLSMPVGRVHADPRVRGTDRAWSDEPQCLASRGDRVIEVDCRGSAGLGWKHFKVGWNPWGQAMQDDLIDALDWAVAQGDVDPDRVCLCGAGYGRHAALMGLVRHPGRYRRAVGFAGVTDLTLMDQDSRSEMDDDAREAGLQIERVDDPAEGHGFFDQGRHADVLRRVETFLARHLKPPG